MAKTSGNEELIQVIPVRTWAEIWQNCTDSRWMLWMLDWVSHIDSELRLFACWCARQAWRTVGNEYEKDLVQMAERFALGKAERQEMVSLWEERRGGAVGAGICGMPKCIPGAAAQLAGFQTCRDEAREAAWSASYCTARAAGFKAAQIEANRIGWEKNCEEKWRENYRIKSFIDENPSVAKEAEEIARAGQADALRRIACKPSFKGSQDELIPAQTLAFWMTWHFVPGRGMNGDWQFSSRILGARVGFSSLLESYSPSGVIVYTSEN